jgi:hypothetical protein
MSLTQTQASELAAFVVENYPNEVRQARRDVNLRRLAAQQEKMKALMNRAYSDDPEVDRYELVDSLIREWDRMNLIWRMLPS